MIKDKFHQVFSYPRYAINAKTAHGVHSPFIFGLINEVLKSQDEFYAFQEIEAQRNILLNSNEWIERADFGAGNSSSNSKKTKVSQFASRSLCSPKYCRMLFRLARYVRAEQVLELGTALGITTAYLSKSSPEAQVQTIEGDSGLLAKAIEVWEALGIKNINSVCGKFEEVLPDVLKSSKRLDFVFVDGNHRLKPTIEYVEMIKQHLNDEAVVIIDDIYWSKEMTEAWETLKKDNTFSLSVDLFRMGLLFKRVGVEKQDFVLYF